MNNDFLNDLNKTYLPNLLLLFYAILFRNIDKEF